MKKKILLFSFLTYTALILISFKGGSDQGKYTSLYTKELNNFKSSELKLLALIENTDLNTAGSTDKIKDQIKETRKHLKAMDIWFRYLEPIAYNKINGPIAVEWENEVFEKFEKPYRRDGAGLTLAELYLDEKTSSKDSLLSLVKTAITATETFGADSITSQLTSYNHFYLCNRLFLLNLAAIYTTGFDCPDTTQIIPELRGMLSDVDNIYAAFNSSYPGTPFSPEYLKLYKDAIQFVNAQPSDYQRFDHFSFIKNYVNPLFALNQQFIIKYGVYSASMVDYSLNKTANSIFKKDLYNGQNPKGIFSHVDDEKTLAEIEKLGKLLFYDPILSGNNLRSCASCHKSAQYFTDTERATSFQFNHKDFLLRNTPSLIDVQYNQLIMLDGKHISLQNQGKGVITSPIELGCEEKDVVKKVLSCKEYNKAFKDLLKYTPQEKEVTFEHIVSAITFYYAKFSKYYSPFDDAMNENKNVDASVKEGFNLFMSKAKCATCHFVPQFNGVRPPFVSSEFEVLGVPDDTGFKQLSPDKGRYDVNPAYETMHAFRTGSLRNIAYTKPYMHNGVFNTLSQVIDFYDAGGGVGHKLKVDNQTLPTDSLKLSSKDKTNLMAFLNSLNEHIQFEPIPEKLPASKNKELNKRKVGGEY